MKKISAIISTVLVSCFSLCGCTRVENPDSIGIYLPDGTPMLAMTQVMAEGFLVGEEKMNANITITQASNIATVFATNPDCDFAIMPTVSAATIYSKGTKVQLASTNVFGNLFVVGVGEADSISELVGKLVYTTSGTTMALLQYELSANNISFREGGDVLEGVVTICLKDSASDYLPLLKQAQTKGTEAYGVLGEPAVTKCLTSVATESKIVVDMQEEYQKLTGDFGYPQASLIVRTSFAEQYPQTVTALVRRLSDNTEYLTQHLSTLQDFFTEQGSDALNGISYSAETISRCNLKTLEAQAVKSSVYAYLANLSNFVESLKNISVQDDFFFSPS